MLPVILTSFFIVPIPPKLTLCPNKQRIKHAIFFLFVDAFKHACFLFNLYTGCSTEILRKNGLGRKRNSGKDKSLQSDSCPRDDRECDVDIVTEMHWRPLSLSGTAKHLMM